MMPLLPLIGEFEIDFYTVTGIMAFPGQPELANRYTHCARFTNGYREALENGSYDELILSIPHCVVHDVILDPQNVIDKFGKSMRKMYIASGMILALLLHMYANNYPEPSIKKAIFFLSEWKDEKGNSWFSDSSLRKIWSRYKPVAHLYAPISLSHDCNFWTHPYNSQWVKKEAFYKSLSLSGKVYNFLLGQGNRNLGGLYSKQEWIVPDEYIIGGPLDLKGLNVSNDSFEDIISNYSANPPIIVDS